MFAHTVERSCKKAKLVWYALKPGREAPGRFGYILHLVDKSSSGLECTVPPDSIENINRALFVSIGQFLLAEELLRGPPSFYTLQTLFILLHSVPKERIGGQEASGSGLPLSLVFIFTVARQSNPDAAFGWSRFSPPLILRRRQPSQFMGSLK